MKITENLLAQHTVFRRVFDHIEKVLPRLQTLSEIQLFGSLVESLLNGHADVENDLAFVALDHALAERGQIEQMHLEHDEIDGRLRQVRAATTATEAKQLLEAALRASRAHFEVEEKTIFPLLEKVLRRETLVALNQAQMER